jgi:hypothetical protein
LKKDNLAHFSLKVGSIRPDKEMEGSMEGLMDKQ